MRNTVTGFALSAMLFALCSSAQGQQPTKNPRIGYLGGGSPSVNAARAEAFRQGLRELGYVEGKNILIEWRSSEKKLDGLPALATELVRLKVDVIVTAGPQQPVRPRKQLLRFPLSWRRIPIPLLTGSSRARADLDQQDSPRIKSPTWTSPFEPARLPLLIEPKPPLPVETQP